MRDIPHIASLIFNTPLLIREDKGEQIINALAPRLLEGTALARIEVERPSRDLSVGGGRRLSGGAYVNADGIAVWPIVGSLVRRGSWLDAECGLMSYGLIQDAALDIFMDTQVKGVLLELDTPGGEAGGCFDTAELLRGLSEKTGKPLWAHANEEACSAGYALGSAASEFWLSRTAMVGSIGVVCAHIDRSKADEMSGVKWTFIKAGEYKTDGNSHEPLDAGAKSRAQADVDNLYGMFVDLVSQHRKMTAEEIRATKADIYRGALAVEAGLADEVGTLDECLEAFARHVDDLQTGVSDSKTRASKVRAEVMGNKTGGKPQANTEVVTEAKDDAEEDEDKMEAGSADDGKKDDEEKGGKTPAGSDASASAIDLAVNMETERCAGIYSVAAQADRLGVKFDAAAAIKAKMSVADARAAVLDAAATPNEEVSGVAAPKNSASRSSVDAKANVSMWKKAVKGKGR